MSLKCHANIPCHTNRLFFLKMQTQFLKYNYRITDQVRKSVIQFLLKDAKELTNLPY